MKLLVTGGGGFLGTALIEALIKHNHQVISFSRSTHETLRRLGARQWQGNIIDAHSLLEATRGCDAVFHMAARVGIWGPYHEFYQTNVIGTENVIGVCLQNKIKHLIFTSSPSVVFHGCDQSGVNESEIYPKQFLAHYPETKAMAEALVLKANSEELATVALRPHLIWGPGDRHLVPRILSRAQAGKLRLVGDGANLVDSVYINNAVTAHLLALQRLSAGSPISGSVYFITNGEPLPIRDLINKILKAGNLPPVRKTISATGAYAVGAIMEFFYWAFRCKSEPLMTRFLARELSCAHWFNISAARKDLGYCPSISIDAGMEKLEEWVQRTDLIPSV